MFKQLAICFLAIQITIQACGKGCLQCTSEDKCVFCDSNNRFKFLPDTLDCKLEAHENCILQDQLGECFACDDHYFIDSVTKKCTAVESQITNCDGYDSAQNCTECVAEYFLGEGCEKVTSVITNCISYSSKTVCETCDGGYYLGTDNKACVEYTKVDNCLGYEQYHCNECMEDKLVGDKVENYVINKNYYMKTFFSKTATVNDQNLINTYILLNLHNFALDLSPTTCEKASIGNCKEYVDFENCQECDMGYFLVLEDNSCKKYPDSRIPNCEIYTGLTTCQKCSSKHYTKGDECIAIKDGEIADCAEYSPTANKPECIQCTGEFYLKTITSCLAREDSKTTIIGNCKSKAIDEDECAECNATFSLDKDGLLCLKTPENCKVINTTPIDDNGTKILRCTTCKDGYYLDSDTKLCKQGTDQTPNCEVYQNSADNCSKCKNGSNDRYFMDGSDCKQSKEIQQCKWYNQTEENECSTCNAGYFPFHVEKVCVDATEVANCQTYSDDNDDTKNCTACSKGYFLNDDSCDSISTKVSDCDRLDDDAGDTCSQCIDGKGIMVNRDDETSCQSPDDFIKDGCADLDVDGTDNINEASCDACEQYHVPISLADNYVCISNGRIVSNEFADITVDTTDDCARYGITGDDYVCEQCKDNYLKDDLCAGTTCDADEVLTYIYGGEDSIGGMNKCEARGIDGNTSRFALKSMAIDGSLINIKCVDTSFPTFDFTDYTTTLVNGEGKNIPSYMARYPELDCLEIAGEDALLDRCHYYASDKSCMRCNFRKKTVVDGDGDVTCENAIVDKCSSDDDKYWGLHSEWGALLNCSKCDDGYVPVIGLNLVPVGDNLDAGAFDSYVRIHSKIPFETFDNDESVMSNVFCADIASDGDVADLVLTTAQKAVDVGEDAFDSTKYKHLEGCGLYILDTSIATVGVWDNTNIASNGDTSPGSLACGACMPGYIRHEDGDEDAITALAERYVGGCKKIEFCDDSVDQLWYDGCSHPKKDYYYTYDSDDDSIDTRVLLKLEKNENCFAVEEDGDDVFCRVCKKDHYLNKDHFCEEIKTDNCDSNWLNMDKGNFHYKLWYSPEGTNNCNQCKTGYRAIKQKAVTNDLPTAMCIKSPYFENPNNFQGDNSVYPTNCLNVNVGGDDFNCAVCVDGYVLSGNSKCYEKKSNLANCMSSNNDGDECTNCDEGFALSGKKCVNPGIANCATYYRNTDNSSKCKVCEDNYFLDSNDELCTQGVIHNCKTYSGSGSGHICEACDDGYFNIDNSLIQGDYDYCYKDLGFGCATTPKIIWTGGKAKYSCDNCENAWAYTKELDLAENDLFSKCEAWNKITSCADYDADNSTDLNAVNFGCSKCDVNFYLNSDDTTKCVAVTEVTNCKDYSTTTNHCDDCNPGYYLKDNKCYAYPIGIKGCRMYTNDETCTACTVDYYFENNNCLKADPLVINCMYYKTKTECETCDLGYILSDNKCTKSTAINCSTYKSITECDSCKTNYFKKDNVCTLFTLDGCAVLETETTCKFCNPNKYLDASKKCKSATLITNCVSYTGAEVCARCNNGFALSKDKKKCIADPKGFIYNAINDFSNCSEIVESDKPTCSMCKAGHYFKDGNCTAFEKNKISDGCFSTLPWNQEKCLFCNMGYYMDKDTKCIKDGDVVNPDPDSSLVRSIIMMMALLMYFF